MSINKQPSTSCIRLFYTLLIFIKMKSFPIDIEILSFIGRVMLLDNKQNTLPWFTAEWLFTRFFERTEILFFSDELCPDASNTNAETFRVCNGGSVSNMDIRDNNGNRIGTYHFNNGCLIYFEVHGLVVNIKRLELLYTVHYNAKYNTRYQTSDNYREYLASKKVAA